jgi:hypothetical protein
MPSSTKSPKSLSGATMGMRFMQRKNTSLQQQQQQQQQQHPTTTKPTITSSNDQSNDQSNANANDTFLNPSINPPLNASASASASCSSSTLQSQIQPQTVGLLDEKEIHNRNSILPIVASASDMYGISAKIIGRRSFNNFHKSVQDTWLNAVKSLSQSKFKNGDEKQQITDEELLERYEKYVKGRGDMVDNKKEKSIGNLNKMKKRKRS